MSYLFNNKIDFVDGQVDAFRRLRTSNPVTLFDNSNQYDMGPLLWDTALSGTANTIHDPYSSAVDLEVGTDANDEAIRQTYEYFRYQPGKSQLILMTGDMGVTDANNVSKAYGYFDSSNGVYVKRYGGVTSWVLRRTTSSGLSEIEVPQSQWSDDRMDGTGPSGITLDITKAQIFMIDLEWLAVGTVRVGFVIDGQPYIVHRFHHANSYNGVYMETANLPIRTQIKNVDGGTGDSFKQICCAVISEGGFEDDRGYPFTALNGAAYITANDNDTPIIAIRPKATFNSKTNRAKILVQNTSIMATKNALAKIVYNPVITGGTWVSVAADSAMEYNITMTSYTGGTTVQSLYIPGGFDRSTRGDIGDATLISKLPLSLDIAGQNPKPLLISASPMPGVTGDNDVAASINWNELR